MSQTPEIRLLKGLSSLDFGCKTPEACSLFGSPQEEQSLSDEVFNTSSLVYHYWDHGFSLFFDNHKGQSFASVEIDNPEALLFGTKVFSLNESQLIELLKQNGYALSESEKEGWGEKRLTFDEAGLDCYFENGRLISVNFGVVDPDSSFYYFPN